MNHVPKKVNRNIPDLLFDEMDEDHNGCLNLENMRKLYEVLPVEYRDNVREKLRKFVIDNQAFTISKQDFLQLFPKNPTPIVHISLGHLKDPPKIRELSPDELKNLIYKRKESKTSSSYKPRFIKKSSSTFKSFRIDPSERVLKSKDAVYVRKAYFSSLSY